MKKYRLFSACCALFCCAAMSAGTLIDVLSYDLNTTEKTATVIQSDTYKTMTSVVIPNTVTNNKVTYKVTAIGSQAFQDCSSLTSVTMPSYIASIGQQAFKGCSGITEVNCLGAVPIIDNTVFSGLDLTKGTLYVQPMYLKNYQAADIWKTFGSVKSILEDSNPSYNILVAADTLNYRLDNTNITVQLPIQLLNAESITAFQFDLYLPDGITLAKEDGDYLIDLADRTTSEKHTVASALQSDGAVRVIVYSAANKAFSGTTGAVINLTLNVANTIADGNYTIQIKNMILSTVDAKQHSAALTSSTMTVKSYRMGDVDDSGTVTITDAVLIINKILGTNTGTFMEIAADVDGNGVLNINDAVALINKYVLNASGVKAHFAKVSAEETTNLEAVPFAINPGEEKTVDIVLNNAADDITAFQTDMNLPEGFSVVKDADGDYSALAMGRNMEKTHQMASNMLENGDLRMICYSMKNASIEGTGGAVATVRVKADNNVVAGVYYLTLHNTVLAHTNGLNAITPADVKSAINVGTTGITDKSDNGLSVKAGRGMVTLQAAGAQNVQIVSADGRQIANFSLQAGEKRTIRMEAGVYVANGKKIAVK